MINIGDILRALGLINRAQLQDALAEQRHNPTKKLGEILVDQHAVKPEQVASCLAKQDGIKRLEASTEDAAKLADYAADRMIENAHLNESAFEGLTGIWERKRKRW